MIYRYQGTAIGPKEYISQSELDVLSAEVHEDYIQYDDEDDLHEEDEIIEDDPDDSIDAEEDEDFSEDDYNDM